MTAPHDRIKKYSFVNAKLEKDFYSLEKGTQEDKELFNYLRRAIADLLSNPLCGVIVPSYLWPKEYSKKYTIDNLRKYDLPDGWRLIYTLNGDKIEVISIILEWMSHKEYERRFKY